MTSKYRGRGPHRQESNPAHANATSGNASGAASDQRHSDPKTISTSNNSSRHHNHSVVVASAINSQTHDTDDVVANTSAPKACGDRPGQRPFRRRDRRRGKRATLVQQQLKDAAAATKPVVASVTSDNMLAAAQKSSGRISINNRNTTTTDSSSKHNNNTNSKSNKNIIKNSMDRNSTNNTSNPNATTSSVSVGSNNNTNFNESKNIDKNTCATPGYNGSPHNASDADTVNAGVLAQPSHVNDCCPHPVPDSAHPRGLATSFGYPAVNTVCHTSDSHNDTSMANHGKKNSHHSYHEGSKYNYEQHKHKSNGPSSCKRPSAAADSAPGPPPHNDEENAGTSPSMGNSNNYANWVNKDFMAIMKAFVVSNDSTELVFPASLTSAQRSIVHRLAATFKLTHKSYGTGEQRALKLTKDSHRFSATHGNSKPIRDNAGAENAAQKRFVKTYSGFQGAQLLMTPYLTTHIITTAMAKLLPLKITILHRLRSHAAHSHARQLRLAQPPLNHIPTASADVLSRQQSLQQFRKALPAYRAGGDVVFALQRSAIVVVSGATGCGKTTQIPQILYDAGIFDPSMSIVCTQPRRISALSIAQRVAEERGEACGNRCGYIIRFENVTSSETRIVYVTTGILLRRLHSDPDLVGIACVVVDEVHERDMETDFCLLLLRDRLRAQRRNPRAFATMLKVVVMSATVQIELLLRYFADCGEIGIAHTDASVDATSKANSRNTDATSDATMTSSQKNAKSTSLSTARVTSSSTAETHSACEPPSITIQGTLFPVVEYFLEDALAVTGTAASSVAAAQLKVSQVNPSDVSGSKNDSTSNHDNNDDDEKETGSASLFDKLKTSVANTIDPNADAMIPYELIIRLITHIHKSNMHDVSGSILVFLPGWGAIQGVSDRLRRSPISAQLSVFMLHSSLTSAEQQRVFNPPPRRYRKVVLSTNLAETSVTINDVVYVIDSGLYKGNRYDASTNTSSLQATMIARANGHQRRGRAGRCRPGVCYHLLPRAVYAALPEFLPPAMMSSALEEVCLQIKAVHPNEQCESVLRRALDPPPLASVRHAVQFLTDMGALSEVEEGLTHLGRALAQLPTHPQLGKMLFAAACLGVLAPVATIAAALSIRSVFVKPQAFERSAARETARRLDDGDLSDHLSTLKVYNGWLRSSCSVSFAMQHGADPTRLRALDKTRGQLERLVWSSALVRRMKDARWRLSCFAHRTALIKLVLTWSLYPRLATVDYRRYREVNKPQVVCWDDKHAVLSPGSVLDMYRKRDFGDRSLIVYYDRMYIEANLNVFDSTAVAPADVLLCVREVTVRPLRELPRDWVLDEGSALIPQLPFDTSLLNEGVEDPRSGQTASMHEDGELKEVDVHGGNPKRDNASGWMAMILDKDKRMYVTSWQVAILLSLARECMNYYLALCIKQLRADVFPVALIFLLCDVMGYSVSHEEQERILTRVRDGPSEREAAGAARGIDPICGDGDMDDDEYDDAAEGNERNAPYFVCPFPNRSRAHPSADGDDDDEEAEEILIEEVEEAFTIELTVQERLRVRDALGDLVLFQSEGVGAKVATATANQNDYAQTTSSLPQPQQQSQLDHISAHDGKAPDVQTSATPSDLCQKTSTHVGGGGGVAVMCVCSSEADDDDEDVVVMEAGKLNIVD